MQLYGVRFFVRKPVGALFTGCAFRLCRFVVPDLKRVHLQSAVFEECQLSGVDFGQCEALGFSVDFRHSKLDNCSFRKRKMSGTPFSKSGPERLLFSPKAT